MYGQYHGREERRGQKNYETKIEVVVLCIDTKVGGYRVLRHECKKKKEKRVPDSYCVVVLTFEFPVCTNLVESSLARNPLDIGGRVV